MLLGLFKPRDLTDAELEACITESAKLLEMNRAEYWRIRNSDNAYREERYRRAGAAQRRRERQSVDNTET